MRQMTFHKQRLSPWLRLACVAYLVCAVVLTMVHQHHGATANSECGLCTAAHTPALMAPGAAQPEPVVLNVTPVVSPEDRFAETTVRQASPSRAPPQAS
jgi:hypothetical protein